MEPPPPLPKPATKPTRPASEQGGWRGREGFELVRAYADDASTRFRLDDAIDDPALWSTYWVVCAVDEATKGAAMGGDAASRRVERGLAALVGASSNAMRLPLRCEVCEEAAPAVTLSNFLHAGASGRCACSSRPSHVRPGGRERVVEAVGPLGWEPTISAEDWDEAMRRRSPLWQSVPLRCVHCGAVRQAGVGGLTTGRRIRGACACRTDPLVGGSALSASAAGLLALQTALRPLALQLVVPTTAAEWTELLESQRRRGRGLHKLPLSVRCERSGETRRTTLGALRAERAEAVVEPAAEPVAGPAAGPAEEALED